MRDFYKPYPKEFYALNKLLPEKISENQPHLSINTINYADRCINYNVIVDAKKRIPSDAISKNISNYLEKNKLRIQRYINYIFPANERDRQMATLKSIISKKQTHTNYDYKVALHHFLVDLYNSFPNHPKRFLDGILRKIETKLSKTGNRYRYVFIDMAEKLPYVGTFPLAKLKFFGYKNKTILIPTDDSDVPSEYIIADQINLSIFNYTSGNDDTITDLFKKVRELAISPTEKDLSRIFSNYLSPFFFNEFFDGKDEYEDEDMERFPYWSFIVFPIYSADLPVDGPHGTVIGHLFISFLNEKKRKNYLEYREGDDLEQFWDSLLPMVLNTIREGRTHFIAQNGFQHLGSLKCLLQNIVHLQDWERILVFEDASAPYPKYCFKRFYGTDVDGPSFKEHWGVCENKKGEDCRDCNHGYHDDLIKRLQSYLNQKKNLPSEDDPRLFETDCPYFFLKKLNDILDPNILPAIDSADIVKYQNYILCFQFSEHTFFPTTGIKARNDIKKLGNYYFRKLIPIFDRLLLKRKSLKHSIKSAAFAIMSRNMSHNIGSHVLSYSSKSIEVSSDSLEENYYSQIRFNEYLRQRMDFIAELTTSEPAWISSMRLCRDIIVPFLRHNILLNYITLSEGIQRDRCHDKNCSKKHRMIHFKVSVGKKQVFEAKWIDAEPGTMDNTGFSYNLNNEGFNLESSYFPYTKNQDGPVGRDLLIENDIDIAVPHGMIGCHGLYSILENFIRNSAKHGGSFLKQNQDFEIKINVDDQYKDMIRITISDNIGNCNYDIFKNLSAALDPFRHPLVDNDGKVENSNWGLKEMRICANFLRAGKTGEVDSIDDFPPTWIEDTSKKTLLQLACDGNCSQKIVCHEQNVNYSFYLIKPKEILVIRSKKTISGMQKKQLKGFESKGIYFVDDEDFLANNDISIPFRFLVIQKNLFRKLNDSIINRKIYLPVRIIFIDNPEAISVENAYIEWFKKLRSDLYNLKITWRGHHANGINTIECVDACGNIAADTRILFDNHGDCNREIDRPLYYQPYKGDERIYRLLSTIKAEKKTQSLKRFELIETSITSVIIADERIWEKTEGEWRFGQNLTGKKRDVLKNMRVRLIPIEDNKISLDNITRIINELVKNLPCFLVIHQGLIDKMNAGEIEELKQLIDITYNTFDCFNYVIASGRGIPKPLYKNAKFIEASNLEPFIEERDKYGLVQTLFSLRRPKDDK